VRLSGLVLLLLAALALPASAVTTTAIGAWDDLDGTANAYSTTMQLPALGFPEATVTSDSRAGSVGVQTGATTWFGALSAPGAIYGSSRDRPYLNLRPKADNASSPSTTTYTFARPTPLGWAFVLGDVDADQVRVSATLADGRTASAVDLGFQDAFNLCDSSPRPSSCSGTGPYDLPSWDEPTLTLRGNLAASDTYGASGWFQPTASLRTLTFTFTRREGFPVFQTWFASRMQDVTGTLGVSDGGTCEVEGATVRLVDATGSSVADTTTDADGAYAFEGVAASPGYRVQISGLPEGCIASSPTSVAIDLSGGDTTADFTIREIIPVPVSGHVRDDDGAPMAGVEVTIDDGTTAPRTATTDDDGYYLFDTNPAATYELTVATPDGYTATIEPDDVTIDDGDETPVINRDFVLEADPDITGTVTGGGGPLGGVTVELDDGTDVVRTTTGPDGSYRFARVPSGDYTISIPTPPADYTAPDPLSLSVEADDDDADLAGQDFALGRPGFIAGTVLLDGEPLAGFTVQVVGTTTPAVELTTDDDGSYDLGDLAPDTYAIVITPPDGTEADQVMRSVTITDAGELVGGQDFALVTEATTPPPDGDGGDNGGGGSDGGSGGVTPTDDGALPDTGGPAFGLTVLGLGLVCLGTVVVGGVRARTRD